MFLGLRMREGVCAEEFERCFGVSLDQVYPGIVEDFCRKGLLQRTGRTKEWISLTDYGIDVSNVVMARFLLT